MLPDLLASGLKLVICGTAAGTRSASRSQYYAGRGNKFWSTLASVGLTPRQFDPSEHERLLAVGIGLTDIVKHQAGMDKNIDFTKSDPDGLRQKIIAYRPGWLCFNGKQAAKEFLGKGTVNFGPIEGGGGSTGLFVAPSTSGAANGTWDQSLWREVADLAFP